MRNNPCRPRHVALDRIVAHFRMRDNHRVISSFTYCYRLFSMLKRKNFRRAKVNCICRCTPQGEVMMLNYKFISQAVDDALHLIANCRSTGVIAATAVRTGRLCETTGHDPLALNIYKTAISAITSIDRDRAELYYDRIHKTRIIAIGAHVSTMPMRWKWQNDSTTSTYEWDSGAWHISSAVLIGATMCYSGLYILHVCKQIGIRR